MSVAPLTIVIPTRNSAEVLPSTLNSLLEGVWEGMVAQLIISDGGSQDDTFQIAEMAGGDWIEGGASKGAQLAAGVGAARTPWLLCLDADTQLAPGWSHAVMGAFNDAGNAHYFRPSRASASLIWRVLTGWRARLLGLSSVGHGLLIHRDLLDQLGGPDLFCETEMTVLRRALRNHLRLIEPGQPEAVLSPVRLT